jgi:hypothetical protein
MSCIECCVLTSVSANIAVAVIRVKMTTAMFARTLFNTQNLTWLTLENQNYILNASCRNLSTRITFNGCFVISKCAQKIGPFNYKATAPRIQS